MAASCHVPSVPQTCGWPTQCLHREVTSLEVAGKHHGWDVSSRAARCKTKQTRMLQVQGLQRLVYCGPTPMRRIAQAVGATRIRALLVFAIHAALLGRAPWHAPHPRLAVWPAMLCRARSGSRAFLLRRQTLQTAVTARPVRK